MGQHVLPGNPPVALTLRRSGRARRISLRVSGVDGRVTLTLPRHVAEKEALDFAEEKSDWLRKQLGRSGQMISVGIGTSLPLEGRMLRVEQGTGPRIIRSETTLEVPGSESTLSASLHGFLKVLARERLVAASDEFAAQLGRSYRKITLRDTRSRWGSCTSEGGLMYSWRLILAPPEVLRYVAAHEVAHLIEMNHSPRFWALVEGIFPDYAKSKHWLRTHGAALHRYRFETNAKD